MNRTTSGSGHWATAVRETLDAAHIPVARLAAEAGLEGPTLFRYLGAQRKPVEHTVRLINESVARLLSDERVGSYLDSCYWLETSDEKQPLPPGTFAPFAEAIFLSYGYLRMDAQAEILKRWNSWPAAKRRKLILAINASYRRRLVRRILGDSAPSKTQFEELRELCARHGWDLTPWLRPRDELGILKERDDFLRALRLGLSAIPRPADRFSAEQAITKAFRKVDATEDRLRIVMSNKNRKSKGGQST